MKYLAVVVTLASLLALREVVVVSRHAQACTGAVSAYLAAQRSHTSLSGVVLDQAIEACGFALEVVKSVDF